VEEANHNLSPTKGQINVEEANHNLSPTKVKQIVKEAKRAMFLGK
jgi:hypothetical protein